MTKVMTVMALMLPAALIPDYEVVGIMVFMIMAVYLTVMLFVYDRIGA